MLGDTVAGVAAASSSAHLRASKLLRCRAGVAFYRVCEQDVSPDFASAYCGDYPPLC